MIVDSRVWTEDRLIEAMWAFMERTGRPPKVRDFSGTGNGLPSYCALRRLIGDEDYNDYCCRLFELKNAEAYFTDFLRSRGGQVVFMQVSKIVKKFETHLDPRYLDRWITKHVGEIVGGYRINRYRGRSVYRAVWADDTLEFPPKSVNGERAIAFTKEDIVVAMKKFYAEHGRYPTTADMSAKNRKKNGFPCYEVVKHRFGNMGPTDIVESVFGDGCIGQQKSGQIAEQLRAFRAEHGRAPTTTELLKRHAEMGLPTHDAVYRAFGGRRYDQILHEVFGTMTFEAVLLDWLQGATRNGPMKFRPRDVALMYKDVQTSAFSRWLLNQCQDSEYTIGGYTVARLKKSKRHTTGATEFVAACYTSSLPRTIESVI